MNLLEKFDKGFLNKTYQRLDLNYKTDIYVGYNEHGEMSLVIIEKSKFVHVKPSKFINVNLSRREDNKYALSFDLLNEFYKPFYLILCRDIIKSCENVEKIGAIYTAITRWKYWKEMFDKPNLNILDSIQIKGLIAELIELRDNIMVNWGESIAIESWMGPLLSHKDFEINDTWYEIKCINENAIQISVSSIEQLDSDKDGYLVVIRLEGTNSVNHDAFNLNQTVISVLNKLNNNDNIELFLSKLEKIGYQYNIEYDNYNFSFKGRKIYKVTSDFPCLRRIDIKKGIGNAKYTILLDSLTHYLEG